MGVMAPTERADTERKQFKEGKCPVPMLRLRGLCDSGCLAG